tara:strand:- start:388 stop:1479 length:1092 start_codon:yes stop_codon:yes gene_type:complete
MKLFKSLLVAPASLGLLAPMAATANEVTINDFNPAEELAITNSRVDGLEARLNDFEAGSFSETTAASFSVDAALVSVDGDTSTENVVFEYQFNIGLSTSFTGEDSLDVAIDSGSDAAGTADNPLAFDTGAALSVDGVTYSFPVSGISMVVGADTDISASFTGACSYSALTDYMGDCGTGNTLGVGGNGVTATGSYAFDSGFSLAAGISSESDSSNGILTNQGTDTIGLEAAYTADSWGLAVAYVSADNATADETTSWGVGATYSFDGEGLPSVSVGYETTETGDVDSTGYFVGLTWPEVGPGSVSVGAATAGNFVKDATEYMTYEASYSYPINDSMTVTPGVYIEETAGNDLTGIIVKTSFSF